MAVSLLWVRDNYDSNRNRHIDSDELSQAVSDNIDGKITDEELEAVRVAWRDDTLLPEYAGPDPMLIWVRDHYDVDKDRYISYEEAHTAQIDYGEGRINVDQYVAVVHAYNEKTLLPEYSPTPPGTETRTMSLTEGDHTIEINLAGYEQLKAKIHVGSTSVTCVSESGFAACGGSGTPRIDVSGWDVHAYMKKVGGVTARCTWIATQDTAKVSFISEMVLAYNHLASIGFTPTASEIGNAVLMYSGLGTPTSLWGC